jgi:hypothetical protein
LIDVIAKNLLQNKTCSECMFCFMTRDEVDGRIFHCRYPYKIWLGDFKDVRGLPEEKTCEHFEKYFED